MIYYGGAKHLIHNVSMFTALLKDKKKITSERKPIGTHLNGGKDYTANLKQEDHLKSQQKDTTKIQRRK